MKYIPTAGKLYVQKGTKDKIVFVEKVTWVDKGDGIITYIPLATPILRRTYIKTFVNLFNEISK